MAEDDDVGLPQKGLNMIIKDVLPEVRIANESRELLNACCVEFVKHVAREAQRISSDDQRKTIYHEHVQKALQNLGFPLDYIEAADSVLDECKIAAEKRLKRKNSRLDKCGIPEEQLYLLQQELIAKARKEEAEKQAAQVPAGVPTSSFQYAMPQADYQQPVMDPTAYQQQYQQNMYMAPVSSMQSVLPPQYQPNTTDDDYDA
ncbi:unnamed protein product [Bursaphelenchus okinawaensis]|uniref:Protein Dr1 n=1 Tax=Bursaphelenchus okinawaensis TaxID=465554 RepID=A0A811LML6_9BILA|nr:unnamed protein product [Bursaphelenchus okinawaensis]CAG9125367.1 unnamed protein product [Bursaphelenchus okinawaensis]